MHSGGDDSKPPLSDSRAPRAGLLLMGLILLVMILVSLYANYERSHIDRIETVTIRPAASISPSPVAP